MDRRQHITCAFGEVEVSFGALVAVESGVVGLARTLAAADLADVAASAAGVAVARPALRIPVVACAAAVTQRSLELGSAFALARLLGAVTRRVEHVALALCVSDCLSIQLPSPHHPNNVMASLLFVSTVKFRRKTIST